MTRASSLERRPAREVGHDRDASAQDTEAFLGRRSVAGRVGVIANSILIHAER
jgi:hypothetical protein